MIFPESFHSVFTEFSQVDFGGFWAGFWDLSSWAQRERERETERTREREKERQRQRRRDRDRQIRLLGSEAPKLLGSSS